MQKLKIVIEIGCKKSGVILILFFHSYCFLIAKTPSVKGNELIITSLELFSNLDTTLPINQIVLHELQLNPIREYKFYDQDGRLVKTILQDSFPVGNPIFKLKFAKNEGRENGDYFQPLAEIDWQDGRVIQRVPKNEIEEQLLDLKKHGLFVKCPQIATRIYGSPLQTLPVITFPSNKYLVTIENASIICDTAAESQSKSNSLLDCSYLSIYNNLGEVQSEILIPNKLVLYAMVSDDGKFMVCHSANSYIWDEGVQVNPTGLIIIDLEKKSIVFNRDLQECKIEISNALFAEKYFQITFGSPYDFCHRLYVNPYNREIYIKNYNQTARHNTIIVGKSFMQYGPEKENLSEFEKSKY